ncbi:MAG: response regulator [Phototrophicales bacterium]|nr:response regulator [Phototrophicales bacterium]
MNTPATVLVVDDEWINRELIEGVLSVFNYQVLLANSGDAALKLLTHQQPDLIVMDVRMPGMDGYELCHAVKSNPQTAHIPVIMVTALELNDEERQKIANAGADDVVSRMKITKALVEKIDQHLSQSIAR